MSETVKRAVDGGLQSLYVTEAQVHAIMNRVRAGDRPAVRRRKSYPLALAAAVAVLALCVSLVVTLRGVPVDPRPLGPGQGESTPLPAHLITPEQAIAAADSYILKEAAQDGEELPALRSETLYRIGCELMQDGRWPCVYYAVHFEALDAYGTEYTAHVSALDGTVLQLERQRGAGADHTAQEVLAGFSRIYGPDRRLWGNEQLRSYVAALRQAWSGSVRWEDLLYMNTGYVDVRSGALSAELVCTRVTELLARSAPEFIPGTPLLPAGSQWQAVSRPRAHYLNAAPRPIWKIAVDLDVTYPDGYRAREVLLVEMDSVGGGVLQADVVSQEQAREQEMFPLALVESLGNQEIDLDFPRLTRDEAEAASSAALVARYGAYPLGDPASYRVTVTETRAQFHQQSCHRVDFAPLDTSAPAFWAWVNWYGEVVDMGMGGTPLTGPTLDDARRGAAPEGIAGAYRQYGAITELDDIANSVRWLGVQGDPAAQLLLKTRYSSWVDDMDLTAICRAVGVHVYSDYDRVLIDAGDRRIWKMAIESNKGRLLVEADSETNEVISCVQVASFADPWYAPYLLQADMEAAGIAPQPFAGAAPVDHTDPGTASGMYVRHVLSRCMQLFGSDMITWTPAQLRAFRESAAMAMDVGGDLGVYCLRSTWYPDVPVGAITREEAASRAAAAIGAGDYTLEGAVLIGTDQTPVWKVRLRVGDQLVYVQVNCITGEPGAVYTRLERPAMTAPVYTDDDPDELWCRDIVLEETVEECESTWNRTSNG